MTLCTTCRSVRFRDLLLACLRQCQVRQEAVDEDFDSPHEPDDSPWARHHDSILEVEKSSNDCKLCNIIFQAFKEKHSHIQEAKGLPIIFRASDGKIEICYDIEGEPTKLCGVDVYMNGVDVDAFFHKCKFEEDSRPPFLKIIEKDPRSKESLTLASNWMRKCLENHSRCKGAAVFKKLPKRLVDVGNESQNPFLVETSHVSEQAEWLSLSYCWGGEPLTKLTNETMDALEAGLPLDRFDPTIRDAILVTRALGITYMWVDALCIIQEEDDSNDWAEQAPRMNEIYGGSKVTLVVADSPSVKEGFLKERETQYIPWSADTESPARVFLSLEWDEKDGDISGPWSKRGWTMQESLLPNRLLHYTSSQMVWKCCEELRLERGVTKSVTGMVTEMMRYDGDIGFGSGWPWKLETFQKFKGFPAYLPTNLTDPVPASWELFRLWYELIEVYTSRDFHRISDRLVAIAGLAKICGGMLDDPEYVAGLWRPDLVRGLTWYIKGAKLIPRESENRAKAAESGFPSWSWASVGYEVVEYGNEFTTQGHRRAVSRVLSVQVNLEDERQPFGAVKGGRITLAGPLKRLRRLYNERWRSAEESMSEYERLISRAVEMENPQGVDRMYSSPPPARHFAALEMLGGRGTVDHLVLEATGEASDDGIHVYRRVGIHTIHYCHESYMTPQKVIDVLNAIKQSLPARLCYGMDEEDKAIPIERTTGQESEVWQWEVVIVV